MGETLLMKIKDPFNPCLQEKLIPRKWNSGYYLIV